MRKLVTIQEIKDIVPIKDADAIELAKILGWQCVVKKGEFQKGDKCVYFEVDAFLPIEPRYEFLVKSSYRKNEIMGEGLRIRTQQMRKCLSQGLALPLNLFPEIPVNTPIDTDISELLNVKKWEMPEVQGSSGTILGSKPFGIPTTDETRVQSIDELRKQLLGKKYYISTKMDGTSCTIYCIDGKIGVCGRNTAFKDDGKCSMWTYVHNHKIDEALKALGRDVIIQGEFCGAGIQKNRLKLTSPEIYVFNIMDRNMHLYDLYTIQDICKTIGMNMVPVEEVGDNFNYTLEELLEKARGKYPSGLDKEGIVVRPVTPEYCDTLGKSLSFKVLNNDFLLKEK